MLGSGVRNHTESRGSGGTLPQENFESLRDVFDVCRVMTPDATDQTVYTVTGKRYRHHSQQSDSLLQK